uniref:Uncharacterized protein n=1 Tax=Acrobeloides nanus TaxID=290746 RepID=A0A914D8M9_9BILA
MGIRDLEIENLEDLILKMGIRDLEIENLEDLILKMGIRDLEIENLEDLILKMGIRDLEIENLEDLILKMGIRDLEIESLGPISISKSRFFSREISLEIVGRPIQIRRSDIRSRRPFSGSNVRSRIKQPCSRSYVRSEELERPTQSQTDFDRTQHIMTS